MCCLKKSFVNMYFLCTKPFYLHKMSSRKRRLLWPSCIGLGWGKNKLTENIARRIAMEQRSVFSKATNEHLSKIRLLSFLGGKWYEQHLWKSFRLFLSPRTYLVSMFGSIKFLWKCEYAFHYNSKEPHCPEHRLVAWRSSNYTPRWVRWFRVLP